MFISQLVAEIQNSSEVHIKIKSLEFKNVDQKSLFIVIKSLSLPPLYSVS